MTGKDAAEILKTFRITGDKHHEAINMAIKALEQEPCEDAISRQEAVEAFQMFREYESNRSNEGWVNRIETVLNQLPPVNPQAKTGHWIMPVQDDGMSEPIYYQVRCSECGFDLDPQTWHMELHQYGADKFCPNCGCRMVEPQESEG